MVRITSIVSEEYPLFDVKLTEDYPVYELKDSRKHALLIEEGYTYIPLNYFIFTEADISFDEVGEMTFLHEESGNEVSAGLFVSDFEEASIYVCLPTCDCDTDCDCLDVTFLIEFNELRIPLHEQIQAQQLNKSA